MRIYIVVVMTTDIDGLVTGLIGQPLWNTHMKMAPRK